MADDFLSPLKWRATFLPSISAAPYWSKCFKAKASEHWYRAGEIHCRGIPLLVFEQGIQFIFCHQKGQGYYFLVCVLAGWDSTVDDKFGLYASSFKFFSGELTSTASDFLLPFWIVHVIQWKLLYFGYVYNTNNHRKILDGFFIWSRMWICLLQSLEHSQEILVHVLKHFDMKIAKAERGQYANSAIF